MSNQLNTLKRLEFYRGKVQVLSFSLLTANADCLNAEIFYEIVNEENIESWSHAWSRICSPESLLLNVPRPLAEAPRLPLESPRTPACGWTWKTRLKNRHCIRQSLELSMYANRTVFSLACKAHFSGDPLWLRPRHSGLLSQPESNLKWRLELWNSIWNQSSFTWNSTVASTPCSMTSKKHSFAESGSSKVNSTLCPRPTRPKIEASTRRLAFSRYWTAILVGDFCLRNAIHVYKNIEILLVLRPGGLDSCSSVPVSILEPRNPRRQNAASSHEILFLEWRFLTAVVCGVGPSRTRQL